MVPVVTKFKCGGYTDKPASNYNAVMGALVTGGVRGTRRVQETVWGLQRAEEASTGSDVLVMVKDVSGPGLGRRAFRWKQNNSWHARVDRTEGGLHVEVHSPSIKWHFF